MVRKLAVILGSVLVVVGGLAAPPTPAAAERSPAPEWGPTTTLPEAHRVQSPQLVTAPGDNRTVAAAWVPAPAWPNGHLMVRVRYPGQAWGPAVEVGYGNVEWMDPWIGVDGDGGVTAVWAGPGGNRLFSRYKPSGSGWQAQQVVHHDPEKRFSGVQLTVGESGAAMVTWYGCAFLEDWERCRDYAAYRTGAGAWDFAGRRERMRYAYDGPSTIDGRGTAARYFYLEGETIAVEHYHPSTGWSSARVLAWKPYAFEVAGNADGTQIVVYKKKDVLLARMKRPGSEWTAPRSIGEIDGAMPKVALDDHDRATVVFRDAEAGGALAVVLVFWSASLGHWVVQHNLLTAVDRPVTSATVSVDADGHLVAAWLRQPAGADYPVVWAAYRRPGSGWSTPTRLSARNQHKTMQVVTAMRSDGVPLVGWRGNRGDEPRSYREYRVRQALAQ